MRLHRFAFLTLGALLFLGLSPRAEAQPALTVSDVTKAEGNAGITNMNFTVTKAAGLAADVTVTTTGVTATGGVDYTDLVAFAFHMNAGQTSKNLTVQVNGDLTDEDDETLDVTFTAVTVGLTINGGSTDTRTGTIAADDHEISIGDFSANEGTGAGNTGFGFTVSLNGTSAVDVKVRATTSDVTAQGGGNDYVTRTTVLVTIPAGSSSANFNVNVKKDPTPEADETFEVTLTAPVNGQLLGNDVGTGTIVNDDVGVSVGDSSLSENGGSMVFAVTRTLNTTTVGFNWATAVIAPANSLHAIGGASCAGAVDYVTSSANVTMSIAGPLTTLISVPICGDTTPESHETFQVNLTGVSGATLTDGIGVGTINNDDALPTGALKISEFRATGPLGALTDGFVEIANTTGSALTIGALDLSPGFSVWTSGATKLFRIDNGVTIPAYGHYLAAGAGYSLSAFGGGAPGDTPFLTSLAPSTGIALYDHDANTLSPLDSVDFVGGPLVEGTGLASIGIPTGPHNFSFARRFPYGGGTVVLDNNDNVNDFALVAVDAGTYVTTLAVLGGPSPEGLTSEPERDAATEITLGLLDTAVGSLTAPNYQFVAGGPNAKYIELRRKATSAVTYANFRFKVTSLSTVHDDAGGTKADFRVTTSPTLVFGAGTANALTLEDFAAGGYLLSVPPALAFPALTAQGGLNSTLRAPALAAGVPLGVNFRMFYSTAGLPGFFWVTAEAKP